MFRFEDLEVWRKASQLSLQLLKIVDNLEQKRLGKFAEQLRGATLSITNNIAEGSGSTGNGEFIQFLGYAKRSLFEVANMIILFRYQNYIDEDTTVAIKSKLEEIGKMLSGLINSLKRD